MKTFPVCLFLLIGLALLAQGCGSKKPEKPVTEEDRSAPVVSELRTNLSKAAEELGRQKEENNVLAKEVTRLKAQVSELEEKAARQPAPAPPPVQEAPSDEGLNPKTRVSLMGAKAVAEFRAQQLSGRVDKLTKDLEAKEQELREIRANAERKEAELAKLSQTLNKIQGEERSHSQEVNAKLSSMSQELAARSEESKRFKAELAEKAALLETLQKAVNDASKLKVLCESQAQELRTALNSKEEEMAKIRKQLEDAIREGQQYQVSDEDVRRQLTFSEEAVERFRRQASQASDEIEQLKAEITKLTKRLQEAEAKDDGEPSAVEQILKTPVSKKPDAQQKSLY